MEPLDNSMATLHLPPHHQGQLWQVGAPAPGARRQMHRHRELEFNLVAAGRAAYILHDRRTRTIRRHTVLRGTLLFLFPEQDHFLTDRDELFSMWIGVFTPDLIEQSAQLPGTTGMREPFPPPKTLAWLTEGETQYLETLLLEVQRAEDQPSEATYYLYNIALRYVLSQAWALYQSGATVPEGATVHPAVAKAAALLQAETEPLSLRQIAQAVALSPAHLSRLFYAQTGETITIFRNRRRLERFLSDPDRANKTLLARALDAGFGSYAQFHRAYRSAMGHAPKAGVRKQMVKTSA